MLIIKTFKSFNYQHSSVGVATPCSQSRCANRTALHPEEGFFLKSDAKVVLYD